ncbi:response regulator [candidate division KSB1 bacterium]|nr:response regulator [candidate division KSB1 bacterium]
MFQKVIILVDDEKIILDSLKTQLKNNFGNQFIYEVAENADDATEVIEEMVKDGYDIIIIVSDWLMPGINGDEFLIRIHQKYPQIVKIMLTGQADDTAVQRAKNLAHLHCCIFKPWTEKELVDTIKSCLGDM